MHKIVKENSSVICPLVQVYFHGLPRSNRQWLNFLQKLNMFKHHWQLLKQFGLEEFVKILEKSKRKQLSCFVTTNQQLQWPKILVSTVGQDTLQSNIILLEKRFKMERFNSHIVGLKINLQTLWPRHFSKKSFNTWEQHWKF